MAILQLILCATLLFNYVPAFQIRHSLDGYRWSVHNDNFSINITANVPGGIYSDLHYAEVLSEDFFYQYNDVAYRWVARENWTYTTSFQVDETTMSKKNIFLVFHGLDTVSQVVLNNNFLGSTENMFIRYRFDVKHLLMIGSNKIEVLFMSPVLAAKEAARRFPFSIPPNCVPDYYNGECHVNFLRKMQASFGWDWGPAFPSVGIWKSVVLEAYDKMIARSVSVEMLLTLQTWVLSASLYLEHSQSISGILLATLQTNNSTVTSNLSMTVVPDENSESVCIIAFPVPKAAVDFWWPNGMGKQPLYDLTVSFVSGNEITALTVKIGFRTVQLIQRPVVPGNIDKGLTFHFQVNEVPVFAKGSNYIPAHILPELSSSFTAVNHLLQSAKEANMNMLRVWGGGLYESELFYKICDELGLLIWQDFMFACSMYPASNEFLQSVTTEVKQQVRRLQYHPSIVVWAGNNENEAALRGNWYGTQTNFTLYKNDYVKLYVDTISPIVKQNDKSRSYIVSSPSNGIKSEQEGYIGKDPYDPLYGDVHFYIYMADLWKSQIYPITRFASEYGVQSLPSLESFGPVTLPHDLVINSTFMMHRQHHLGGYEEMSYEIKQNLPLPPESDIDRFIYFSQINQAVSIKTETERYRRGRNIVYSTGEGLTMGALYWQLNDVWQAPSWSSIEFNGKWKMLHYFAVDFFAPLLITPELLVSGILNVFVVSDLLYDYHASVTVSVYRWDSLKPQYTKEYNVFVKNSSVIEVDTFNLNKLLQDAAVCGSASLAKLSCFIYLSVKTQESVNSNNFVLPCHLSSVNGLKESNITVLQITAGQDNKHLHVMLKTDAVTAFVWLDVPNIPGHFSQNGFLLVTPEITITFYSYHPVGVTVFKDALEIKALQRINVYKP